MLHHYVYMLHIQASINRNTVFRSMPGEQLRLFWDVTQRSPDFFLEGALREIPPKKKLLRWIRGEQGLGRASLFLEKSMF